MSAKLGRIVYTYDYNKKAKLLTLKKHKYIKGFRDTKLNEGVTLNAGDICLIFDPKSYKSLFIDNNHVYNKVLVNGNILWVNSNHIYTDLTKAEVY
jgi:hypothetical protein